MSELYQNVVKNSSPIVDFSAFFQRLNNCKKLYCSNDLEYGLKLLPVNLAVTRNYIQVNTQSVVMCLVIDVDKQGFHFDNLNGVAPPNFIVCNQNRIGYHLIWLLETPIPKTLDANGQNKALYMFAKIQQAYTKKLNGDPQYIGMIAKNPLSSHWHVINYHHWYFYTLNELAEYVTLPKYLLRREAIGEGRNCTLFETVRKFSYKEVLFYKKNGATESDFYNVILSQVEKLNSFEKSPPLPFSEIKAISKSISKWTWQHFTEKGFSNIQKQRNKKSIDKRQANKQKRLKTYEKIKS